VRGIICLHWRHTALQLFKTASLYDTEYSVISDRGTGKGNFNCNLFDLCSRLSFFYLKQQIKMSNHIVAFHPHNSIRTLKMLFFLRGKKAW
jgi:hypothetical protein